jgi:nicotinamide riboside kinase
MDEARRIAIVGAESTGKSTLARELAAALAAAGLRVAHVDEHLREWCDLRGRTPQAAEQAAILREQHRRIDAAAVRHDVVVCDTTGLVTAAYSRLLFDDASLEAEAAQWHRRCDVTLLTALDLPWVPDGLQRDGAHVREPVDSLLRAALDAHRLPYAVVGGSGPRRLSAALDALPPAWRGVAPPGPGDGPARAAAAPRGGGLFTRLEAGDPAPSWNCECCVPAAERLLRRGATP